MYGDIDWFEVILAQKQTIDRLEEEVKNLRAEVNFIAANKVDIDGLVCEKVEKTIEKYDLNNNLSFSKNVVYVNELAELVSYLNNESYKWHNADTKISRVEHKLAELNTRMFNAEMNFTEHDRIIKRTMKKINVKP